MKKIILLFTVISILGGNEFFGQKTCATDSFYLERIKIKPSIVPDREAFLEEINSKSNSTNLTTQSSATKIIPVVFHIIHNYGAENISKNQILDQLRILNEDFRKKNADTTSIVASFKPIAADCDIEFRLAQIDPQGNCAEGITRTASSLTYGGDNSITNLISWNTQKYLNVYVFNQLGVGGAAGYTFLPGTFNAGDPEDAIYMSYDYIGSIGTSSSSRSRTLTHEIGHWLGLQHTWGSGNNNNVACGNDGVNDTPITKGSATSVCNLNLQVCGSVIENVQNYMDYSYCSKMFTAGQKLLMQSVLNSNSYPRKNIWSTTNLNATGALLTGNLCPPTADFIATKTTFCAGSNTQFTDKSFTATPTQWLWTFAGGTPSTSTLQNPIVTYSASGMYSITLTASNSIGSSTKTRTSYVDVLSTTADYANTYSESFEVGTIPNVDWTRINDDGGTSWTTKIGAASSGNKSAYINNSNNTDGEIDELVSPSINIASISNAALSFKLSYAQKNSGNNDRLQVYTSVDCGVSWSLRYNKAGSTLATVSAQASAFTPNNAAQWRKDIVNISPVLNSTNVLIKFKFTYNNGNNIYIDEINLQPTGTGIDEYNPISNFMVYPSSTSSLLNVNFYATTNEKAYIKLFDMLGKELKTLELSNNAIGSNTVTIDVSNYTSGIYFISMGTKYASLKTKFIKQ
ncbi:MAG: PKD domain-containing protein [Bacteroidetes bacterium]|nr:PKD domain-containing protein [Bacteroidota bacterium]